MGNRFHNNRYPKYSHKGWHKTMPPWLRAYGHRRTRRITKNLMNLSEIRAAMKRIRGVITYMWY